MINERLSVLGTVLLAAASAAASDLDEFKVKREPIFTFAQKPTVTREGDKVTISFASKGFCDATVAVQDAEGRILRHLACGVLGKNAPPPFQKGSPKQVLVWDGKDDQGRYVDGRREVSVRVSLGLRARFERTLFWSPYKRYGGSLVIHAAPEGVYVFDEGGGVSQLRLFDHDGNYVRTLYPFPADKVASFDDLKWYKFPQDGVRLPRKRGHRQCTLLTSGVHSRFMGTMGGGLKHSMPDPAKALAVHGKKVALAYVHLNRLSTDGASRGMALQGGRTGVHLRRNGLRWRGGEDEIDAPPTSMAFSPDGKWLYTTAYAWMQNWGTGGIHEGWLNGVGRVAFEGDAPMQLFAGNIKGEGKGGTGPGEFRTPSSVACDAQGRVYVADNLNDRIQVFSPDGKFLKAIKVTKPAEVAVHSKSGRIYVLCWLIRSKAVTFRHRRENIDKMAPPPKLLVLRSFDDPKEVASYRLPRGVGVGNHEFEIDTWTDPIRVWVSPGKSRWRDWEMTGIRILRLQGRRLTLARDFGREARRAILRTALPRNLRQRLYVSPTTGKLYLAEGDAGVGKSVGELLEIDPDTGRSRSVSLPFDAEDLAFDQQGFLYLRARTDIARYDPKNWREVPFDYGEQRKAVGFASSRAEGAGMRRTNVASSLRVPTKRYNHHGGMMVNAKGHIVVGIHGGQEPQRMRGADPKALTEGRGYAFRLYPGRATAGLVLVFDKHGKVLYDDVFPGIAFMHGIGIDRDDNIYAMAMAHRVLDGVPYYNEATNTLIKVRPGRAKVYATHGKTVPVRLTDALRPERPHDLIGSGGARLGRAWVERAEWLYGGVGYHGRHSKTDGYGCDCSNSRFDLDYFARSFAPEVEHCSVAVLDSAGNLILRVGTYGNVDDGVPLSKAGGPAKPRSIGPSTGSGQAGDEVALFYAPYVGVHTDRRLFIADPGNGRIVSVKLGYHAMMSVALKDVPEGK